MQIDWKTVSRSEGYGSLKAAYMSDLRAKHRSRSKAELQKHFRWVIGRAMHYAVRQGRELHHVLNQWERERQSWWFGWYIDHRQPKLPSGKPRNVKPMKSATYVRSDYFHSRDPIRRFKSIRDTRRRLASELRAKQGKKERWSTECKRREAQYRFYRQQKSL